MSNILVVEDDTAVHSLLKEALELNGFQVFDAYSGTEGVMVFEQHSIDVVLLDLMLPGMSGEDTIKKIRDISNVPVIAVSAKVDQESKLNLLTNGADDYVTKPFDLKELIARIKIQLRHIDFKSELNSDLNYLNIMLNVDTREVSVAGKMIHLTSREFSILKLLMKNPNKVFSRSNLYESIWNEPYLHNDKTVNMHISNLRSKLNKYGDNYISTVWGIGFKLEGETSDDNNH